MPLLVARRAVAGASMAVRLDRANAMSDAVTLAEGEVLDVAARLSMSGSVTSSSGDPEAKQDGVVLRGGVTAVSLALARASDRAPPVAPGNAAQTQRAAAAVIRMNVALAPGVVAAPPARVFVIARVPNGPPMPIAVRALNPAALPEQLELTDRDAMQPGRVLSMFDRVEVLARLSRSGNPVSQSGDVESAAVLLDPRGAEGVSLIIGG
jgi:cytochrome c-type biogenesis protein CcmH